MEKRERERKKFWFALLISYKENISTHSEWLSFSLFVVFSVQEKKKIRSLFLEVCPLLAT
jgi:hypothetical protein